MKSKDMSLVPLFVVLALMFAMAFSPLGFMTSDSDEVSEVQAALQP